MEMTRDVASLKADYSNQQLLLENHELAEDETLRQLRVKVEQLENDGAEQQVQLYTSFVVIVVVVVVVLVVLVVIVLLSDLFCLGRTRLRNWKKTWLVRSPQ